MTEEEKKAAEIAEAEVKKAEEEKANAEFEASLEGLSEEEKTQRIAEKEAEKGKEIDFETELKLERERRERAEKIAAEKDFKLRELKRKKDEELDENGNPIVEKSLTVGELEAILARERQQTRKEFQSEAIVEKVGKRAVINRVPNEALKNLIVEIHNNRTFPESMTLDEQLDEAHAIALSKPSMKARLDELQRTSKSNETKSDNPASSHREFPVSGEPKLEPKDISAIKTAGYTWDGKANVWKLETKSRIVFKSKDLKKTWTVLK